MKTTKLYRPVGKTELSLIEKANFNGFPPRLPWQPIFYPVLNQAYAEQIALDWNTTDEFSGYAGFITEFELDDSYLSGFKVENVGGKNHNELWIPSEELENFNEHIKGKINIINGFFGVNFKHENNQLFKKNYEKFKQKN